MNLSAQRHCALSFVQSLRRRARRCRNLRGSRPQQAQRLHSFRHVRTRSYRLSQLRPARMPPQRHFRPGTYRTCTRRFRSHGSSAGIRLSAVQGRLRARRKGSFQHHFADARCVRRPRKPLPASRRLSAPAFQTYPLQSAPERARLRLLRSVRRRQSRL